MASPLATGRKSLANLGEPINISFAIPALALLALILGSRASVVTFGVVASIILCIVAAATFFFTPFLPE